MPVGLTGVKTAYFIKGGGQSNFSLYSSDIGLRSSRENSTKARPLHWVTPSAYRMSFSLGSYSLLDISIACKQLYSQSGHDHQTFVPDSYADV